MESKVYNQKGEAVSKVTLPKSVFETPWNADMVHQVVVSMTTSMRKPVAHTKNRGEVSGGGKKPWQQKGTGRARHGSTRSPIWVGGGVAHGPRNDKNFERKINKKMKIKALFAILSRKFKDGEILFVDNISLSEPKTKEALKVMKGLGKIKGFENLALNKKTYIAVSEKDRALDKSFGNFSNISLNETRNLNPVDALNFKYLIITDPEKSLSVLESKIETAKSVK